ncbi:MAG: hypothetical protein CVV06_20020 [Gammaproteobacteria bacterium HGW-Gammaproteobacteria-10]|nr:MAG: hypothetical protein CVV06_20020 [Gammaproteobacteria bacterium HGW-Gammaproteobacteria-10]
MLRFGSQETAFLYLYYQLLAEIQKRQKLMANSDCFLVTPYDRRSLTLLSTNGQKYMPTALFRIIVNRMIIVDNFVRGGS